ncbi:MAG: KH domain-containing protein [Actinobacteria bacterium]|nr:MAG: KH domain-containing protein [Actinomycetota bacterium]
MTAHAEGEGATLGEAKWSAVKALEREHPGITADDVTFEVLDEGDEAEGRPARVRGEVDPTRAEQTLEMPEAPAERVRVFLGRVILALDLRASVDIEEDDEEIRATVNGDDLGLMIGKHGSTIDALQHLAVRIAFRGRSERKSVVVDAAGYRERREGVLRRSADRAVAEALDFGRPVELEPMSASERRIVHTYLRDRADVQTHSEGDEPDRRLVVTPVRSG